MSTQIWTGEAFYLCASTSTVKVCTESVESLQNVFQLMLEPAPDLKTAIEADLSGYAVTELPSRQIVEITASCFQAIREEQTSDRIEICLSPQGIPLLLDSSAEAGDITVMALELGRDIPDNHFSPPYPVE
jgi:hypothetical protein